jgi:hypothetical protein
MSRLMELEARRLRLLHRCEEQRVELSDQIAQLRARDLLAAWTRRSATGSGKNALPWIAGAVGLLWMLRRRSLLSGVGWLTGLVALASRATTILRVVAQLSAVYRTFRAAQQR